MNLTKWGRLMGQPWRTWMSCRKEAASYQREIALLQGRLKDKGKIITLPSSATCRSLNRFSATVKPLALSEAQG